jgi:hypothetical protein
MKRIIVIGVVAAALASATAYAQMQHGPTQGEPGMGMMHEHMKKKMQGKMHGKMHGGMHGGQTGGHGSHGAGDGTDGHGMSAGPQGDQGPSSAALHAINKKMHEGMNITFTGNADRDFINGMIPHHQGAVEMAKVVLAFGSDPEIRKLAEAVIQAQEGEIALMRAWLERNAK